MFGGEDASVPRAFGRAMAELWARDGIGVEEPGAIAETVAVSFAAGEDRARSASDLLIRSGIRARWNDVLRHRRAAALAERIRPFVAEPLLDVLAGDGSICGALADRGVARLTATERAGAYAESSLPPAIAFQPFADDLDFAQFGASTALLSTVLHHEPDPIRLLDTLARAAIPRWIVVENCVTEEYSRTFHQFADRFFNSCLNDFDVACVEQHRTLVEWSELLARYGRVTIADESFTVPGIPFPYSLLIVRM